MRVLFKIRRFAGKTILGIFDHLIYHCVAGVLPRDKEIWLFGAWEGGRYCDNAKYLFEYLLEHQSESPRLFFWVTKSYGVFLKLRSRGYPVLWRYSIKAWWYHLRAGLILVTHARHDVVGCLTRGAKVIYLNHALPIKHMGSDAAAPSSYEGRRAIARRLLNWILEPYWNARCDYALSASRQVSHIVVSSKKMPPEKVLPLGFPRFEPLLAAGGPVQRKSLGGSLEGLLASFSHVKHRILYMPTFRDRTRFSHFDYGFDLHQAGETLERLNAVLIMALHPFDTSQIPPDVAANKHPLIRSFQPTDVNELLVHMDVLITDYSSVMFDFLLLDRPIVYTQFDFLNFTTHERGLYFPYDKVTPGCKAANWSEVWVCLGEALSQGVDRFKAGRQEVRQELFHANYGDINKNIVDKFKILLTGD